MAFLFTIAQRILKDKFANLQHIFLNTFLADALFCSGESSSFEVRQRWTESVSEFACQLAILPTMGQRSEIFLPLVLLTTDSENIYSL